MSPRARGALILGFAIASALFVGPARRGRAQDRALYESARVDRQLRARDLRIEPDPEGKRIAFIALAREEVFVEDELWPVFPNLFHIVTKEDVIMREMLVHEGDPYRAVLVDESARNLWNLGVFTLVRIVPVRRASDGAIGLLVYTRELWSLRLETTFAGTGGAFAFSGQLTERNLLGRGKLLSIGSDIDPKTVSIGQLYWDARVFGQELLLKESFDVIVNRARGVAEGTEGAISFGRPYYRLQQPFSWTLSGAYGILVARALRGGEVASFRPDDRGRLQLCTSPDPECVRSVWDDRSAAAKLSGSYRRGVRYTQTFTASFGFSDRSVHENAETQLMPDQRSLFETQLLPHTERQVYPALRYDLDLPQYATYFNMRSFGQSETVQLGPVAMASVAVPLAALGSTRNVLSVAAALGYVLGDGQGLLEGRVEGSARLFSGRVSDQVLSAYLRGATPAWFAGRFVFRAGWEGRRRDTTQTQAVLGGDNGLRGYQAGAFRVIGGNRLRLNAEYRTLPLVFEAVHLGLVAFYDGGSVYASRSTFEFHQAVGLGARVLFPQFNRSTFRFDFGVPLDGRGFSIVFSYGGEQAILLTRAEDLAAAAAQSSGAR